MSQAHFDLRAQGGFPLLKEQPLRVLRLAQSSTLGVDIQELQHGLTAKQWWLKEGTSLTNGLVGNKPPFLSLKLVNENISRMRVV